MVKKTDDKTENKVFNAPYVSAGIFLESAKPIYQFQDIQGEAFKVRMKSIGKYYLPTLEDFVPYFEEYLGIDKEKKVGK